MARSLGRVAFEKWCQVLGVDLQWGSVSKLTRAAFESAAVAAVEECGQS